MKRILLTRPLAQSQRFAQDMGAGYAAVLSPLLQICYHDGPVETGAAAAVIFTSANGVTGWMRRNGATTLPAWCVGPRTARMAAQAGFHVQGIEENLPTLAHRIAMEVDGPVLHIRGEHVSAHLSDLLPDHRVESCIVYTATPQALSEPAIAALCDGAFHAIPVFSPRSAQRLVAAYQSEWQLGQTRILAISDATAQVLHALPAQTIETALSPNSASVLALLRRSSAQ